MKNQKNYNIVDKISDIFEKYKKISKDIDLESFRKEEGCSSIGKHVRHVIDRINCFVNGYELGEVDYDNRKRDSRLEQNPDLCCKALDEILPKLDKICHNTKKLIVLETVSEDGYRMKVESTSQRELLDVFFHMCHHLAIIKFLLEKDNIKVEDSLGKNPSTVIYEKES